MLEKESKMSTKKSTKLTAVPNSEEMDVEELAAKQKLAREEQCSKEINGLLEMYKCEMRITVQIGQQQIPLAQVLSFPGVLLVVSKQN